MNGKGFEPVSSAPEAEVLSVELSVLEWTTLIHPSFRTVVRSISSLHRRDKVCFVSGVFFFYNSGKPTYQLPFLSPMLEACLEFHFSVTPIYLEMLGELDGF